MIYLSVNKVCEYLIILTLFTLPTPNVNAESLKPKFFFNENKNTVLENVREDKNIYLIQATFSDEKLNSTSNYRTAKLNLFTRYALSKHLAKKYKGIRNFQLHGIQTLESGKSGKSYYQISQLPIANITPLLTPVSDSNSLSIDIIESSIEKEIKEFELKAKANPKFSDNWKNLYNLYFITGDLDKADFALNNVILMEFEK